MRKYLIWLLLFFAFCTRAVYADEKEYITLEKTIDSTEQGTVIEFFSFYCPPCFAFSAGESVDKSIRKILAPEEKMVKYHAGFLGPLGDELTRAWSLAMLLGIEEKVEYMLFDAVQNKKKLKSPDDIKAIFVSAGIKPDLYDVMISSQEVKDLTEKQKSLFKEYGVSWTPSIFINGKYLINNNSFHPRNCEELRNDYSKVVRKLLDKNDNDR
ncbi:DsbA family protein [Escherichia albertii]|uniref:DsbA family protein n=1 Tax=Escherichia albertii TaxID=208962 RepID=UPI003F44C833